MLPEAAGEHDGSLLVLTQAEKSPWPQSSSGDSGEAEAERLRANACQFRCFHVGHCRGPGGGRGGDTVLASRRPQPMLSTKAIGEQHRVCGLAAGHADPRTPIPCWPLQAATVPRRNLGACRGDSRVRS